MDVNKLPLNQKRTIVAQKFIIAVAERVSDDDVIISYINLQNHTEVLQILQKIEDGAQTLKFFDEEYWDIYTDGNFINKPDISKFKDLQVKIHVNAADKLLEIDSFQNEVYMSSVRHKKLVSH